MARLPDQIVSRLLQLRDPVRRAVFMRFLARRFWDDNLFQSAGSLAYTTVFALVPLATVVFGMLAAFPVYADLRGQLTDYVFSNFVPSAASQVQHYISEYSLNASQLTAAGIIALVLSLLITLTSVESIFNRIWRVPVARPRFARFLVYWTVLTLGTLIAVASMSLSAKLFAMSVFASQPGRVLETFMLRMAPPTIELVAFMLLYKVVPHRTVQWRHAFAGALLATVAFEFVKWGMGVYLGTFRSYEKLYGTVAFIPIFLLWIYLSWVSVLLGASFASSLSAFRYQPAALRLPEGCEIYGLLRMLGRFQTARGQGHGLHADELRELDPILTDSLVQDMLSKLSEAGIVKRAETGEWLLSRDLADVGLGELYVAAQLRIPVEEACLPMRDDALGSDVMRVIDELRLPLRDAMKRKVATIYSEPGNEPP
ncbi:MAG: YihY family inner membrane protein [Proteobacteria bacterium]|nr:YihY family inner membrane protein [Pseudomonadota bacterium]